MSNDILVMLKVAERCNINCSYCYMYNGIDQSWKHRPHFLSDYHLDLVVFNLLKYHTVYPDARLTLEIHGGEPLLMGKNRMQRFLGKARQHLPNDQLFICIQTNGILLDVEWLKIFEQYQATVSISCDGFEAVHNSHRVSHQGKGTFFEVEKAIRLCLDYPSDDLFNGILAVVDPNFNGIEIVDYFYKLGVKNLDFLLPDSNFISPPQHIENYNHSKMIRFLRTAFDKWVSFQDPSFRVRIFETFIMAAFGKSSDLDAFGGDLSPIVVIETDGSYRLLDVLSICENGATETKLKLESNSINDFLEISKNAYPQVSKNCRICPVFSACGGGYLAHRFNGTNYDGPSFYCPVLFDINEYIISYLKTVVSKELSIRLPDINLFKNFKVVLEDAYNVSLQKSIENTTASLA